MHKYENWTVKKTNRKKGSFENGVGGNSTDAVDCQRNKEVGPRAN